MEEEIKVKKKCGRKPYPKELLEQHRRDYHKHYYLTNRDRLIAQRKALRDLPIEQRPAKRILRVPRDKYHYSTIHVTVGGLVQEAHTIGYLAQQTGIEKAILCQLRKDGILPMSPFRSNRGECYTVEMAYGVKLILDPVQITRKRKNGSTFSENETSIRNNIKMYWTMLGVF